MNGLCIFRWCKVEKWNRFSNILVLIAEGAGGVKDFLDNRDGNKNVAKIGAIFKNKLEFL